MIAPRQDAFGSFFDDAAPSIILNNGRVFQVLVMVPLLGPDGTPLKTQAGDMEYVPALDDTGLPITDMEATFKAHHDWLAAHPEERFEFLLLAVLMALAGGDPGSTTPTE